MGTQNPNQPDDENEVSRKQPGQEDEQGGQAAEEQEPGRRSDQGEQSERNEQGQKQRSERGESDLSE